MNKILLIDDDPLIQYMYGRLLRSEGYHLEQAADAENATEIMISKKIDLVLLDIRMPQIDGKFMKEVLAICAPKTKVIVSSAYPIVQQKRDIPGAFAYFDKSEGTDRLLALIAQAMQSRELRVN